MKKLVIKKELIRVLGPSELSGVTGGDGGRGRGRGTVGGTSIGGY